MDESKELIVISAKSFQKETTWEYLLLDSDTCSVLFQKLVCTYLPVKCSKDKRSKKATIQVYPVKG